jgi:hypothetical protein
VTGAEIVTCDVCGQEWLEDDDGVRVTWTDEVYCTDHEACATRLLEQEIRDGVQ